MASARRTGTNENVSTYGTGKDYTSMSTWEADTDNDLVTATQSEVLECYDTDSEFDDLVAMAGATTSASYFRIVRPADGEGHDGTSNNGVFIHHQTTDYHCLSIGEFYSSVQDLIVKQSISTTNSRYGVLTGALTDAIGIIVFDSNNSSSGLALGVLIGNIGVCRLCLCDNLEWTGFVFAPGAGNTGYAQNCTAVNNGNVGFAYSSGTAAATNCLSDSNSGDEFSAGTWTGSTNNASSDASAPGTSSRTNQTFTFVNEGGDDFHLDSSDTGARGYGVLIAAFDDDIDGDTIYSWPIGFDQPVGINSLRQLIGHGQGTRG